MLWIFAIVVVLVLGGVAVVAAGHGDGLSPAHDDRPDVLLPSDRPLNAGDLRSLRFTVSWRGYRASEVDAVISRLETQLASSVGSPAVGTTPDVVSDAERG